jgi:RNA polymerase sigma-70 factor (ECF subfamily)
MSEYNVDTDHLLRQAVEGNSSAGTTLLDRYRNRLKNMVRVRMDQRLQGRFDPSDVVQDALIEAHRRLPEFANSRPMEFYPWLRGLAWDRLVDLHRQHLKAAKRTVDRELADASSHALVTYLADSRFSPLRDVLRDELRERIQTALDQLSPVAREVLLLRFVEQLSVREASHVLGITESALKSRQLRALKALGQQLDGDLTL